MWHCLKILSYILIQIFLSFQIYPFPSARENNPISRRIKSEAEPYSELMAVKMFFPDYFDDWDKYYFSDLVLFFSLHDILKNPPMEQPREIVERAKEWLSRIRDPLEDKILRRLADELAVTALELVPYIQHYLSYYKLPNHRPNLTELSKQMLMKISQKMTSAEEITFFLFIFEAVANALKR